MTIFVGYGYNIPDKWIEELVFPLIKSYGFSLETGKNSTGQMLAPAIIDKIKKSDGVIVFLTRRNKMKKNNTYSTHRWCIEELITADPENIPSVEIRDRSVEQQTGMKGGYEYIDFDINKKEELFVEIAKLLGNWQKKMRKRIALLLQKRDPAYRTGQSVSELLCLYRFSADQKYFLSIPYILGPERNIVADIKNIPENTETVVEIKLAYKNNPDNIIKSYDYAVHYLLPNPNE